MGEAMYQQTNPNDLVNASEGIASQAVRRVEPVDSDGISLEHLVADPYYNSIKPLFDKLFAVLTILFCAPLFCAIAVAIKLDSPGPVLFRQERTGYQGRRFTMYKFRTMFIDAEARRQELMDQNMYGPDAFDFKLKNDPRITRVGRFLRKTSLDELPNFFNVLRGELSVCGPRPTSFGVEVYGERHKCRLAVRPGITGLWQISGRSDVSFDQRVELDIQYIKSISLLTDTRIILLTVWQCLRPRGAY